MKLKQMILSVVAGGCLTTSVSAQEHPDFPKLVEDTADYIQVAQEYIQQAMTMYVDAINMLNFDFKQVLLEAASIVGEVYFGSEMAAIGGMVGQATSAAQTAQNKAQAAAGSAMGEAVAMGQSAQSKAEEKLGISADSVATDAENAGSMTGGTENSNQVETITIKQLQGGDATGADVLTSILSTDSIPPIVPEEIVPMLEEKQPDPAKIKAKIAELVLIDKSKPDQLYVTQDLQNRLVAAGVMRALDNAKRSFELSAKAQKETEDDRKKIEDSTSFTGILGATAIATVHSYQKLNEIKGLYAQMMELDALGSLQGAELTAEERQKRAQESAPIGERKMANITVQYDYKNDREMMVDEIYAGCVEEYVLKKYDDICRQVACTEKQEDDIAEAKFNFRQQIEDAKERYFTCAMAAEQAKTGQISRRGWRDNNISDTDDPKCVAELQRAMISAAGYSAYMHCYEQGKKF